MNIYIDDNNPVSLSVADDAALSLSEQTSVCGLVVSEANSAGLSVEDAPALSLSVDGGSSGETYEGSYEYTPTNQTQTIRINGKTAKSNIVINPIPDNYGFITWDGSSLTVS